MDEPTLLATIITVLGSVIVAVLKHRADNEPMEDKVISQGVYFKKSFHLTKIGEPLINEIR